MYHNNPDNLEATFVKLSEKKINIWLRNLLMFASIIRIELLFCHCDRQKIEEIVSLLMRYEN